MSSLPEILEKMRRPLAYASKDDFANLRSVRDLDSTMVKMAEAAMDAASGDPPKIEVLRELRLLFKGFANRDEDDRKRRVKQARQMVEAMLGNPPPPESEAEAPPETGDASNGADTSESKAEPEAEGESEAKGESEPSGDGAEAKAEGGKKKRRRRRRRRKKKSPEAAPSSDESTEEPVKAESSEEAGEPKEPSVAQEPSEPKAPEKAARSQEDASADESADETSAKVKVPRNPADARKRLEQLEQPVTTLKGIGPKYAEMLERMGITTVEDLLLTLPRDYQDRRTVYEISHAEPGSVQTFAGEVRATSMSGHPRKIFDLTVGDGTGELHAKWFNYPTSAANKFEKGQRVVLSGKVDTYKDQVQIAHPEIEILEEGDDPAGFARVVPVYPLTEGLTQRTMRRFVQTALEELGEQFVSGVPSRAWKDRELPHPIQALRELHVPGPDVDANELTSGMSAAHRSLAYDELFTLQLGLAMRRRESAGRRGYAYKILHERLARFRELLPFRLTEAQERAIDDIKRDMSATRPMHRLVQGDVGSGKTVVGVSAAILAVENDKQVAFMAPTELVAEQHYRRAGQWLDRLGMSVALLTGSIRPTERDGLYPKIRKGKVDVVIGTHALLSEGVAFKKLGLVIIDEQHRFGVEQRANLKKKGAAPDVLFMTATPIPRSLALTVFGDLDISTIRSVPEGRTPVKTELLLPDEREKAYDVIRSEVAKGRQAYIVYPTIDAADPHVESAQEGYRRLKTDLSGCKIALLHGRLDKDEKDGIINRFRRGAIDVVVATTVVGVGVDVPNATVMLIEGADRFGLADLHQLRGRVGRGELASQCFLVPREDASEESVGRLQVLVDTTDGFRIAEADLVQRGFGDVAGVRQAGIPAFRVTDLARDADLLLEAREDARHLIDHDPSLRRREHRVLKEVMKHRWRSEDLSMTEAG